MSAISDQTPDVYTYTRTMQFSLPSANSAEPSPEIAVSTSREAWSVRQSPSSNESQSNRQQLAAKKALEYNRSLENILEKTRQKIEQQKISEDLQLAEMLKHNDAKNAGLVKGLGELVGAHERRRERRKQLLWKSWHDQVYSRIQGQISEQLAAMSNEEIGDRRRELMDAYIKTADSKEKGVFRDVIFTTEYDPLTARDHYIKYASPRYDPLKAGGGNFGPSDSDGTNARSQQVTACTLLAINDFRRVVWCNLWKFLKVDLDYPAGMDLMI
eukprot:6208520-Pleurochrysis_carterae.AAC.1